MQTPHGWQADTGQGNRYETAAGTCNISQGTARSKREELYRVTPEDGGQPFTIAAKGREAWTLDRLIKAGSTGCTPLTEPAPRWSSYVHKLRRLGVPIETLHEQHGGAFSGTHGRYVLRASVQKGGDIC